MSNGFDFSPKIFGELKNKMCAERSPNAMEEFYKIFARMVKEGSWVHAPINDKQLVISQFRGGGYIAIYSSLDNRVAGDSKEIIAIDINKFIDVLYDNPSLLGIVVDPNKEPFLLNRRAIHEYTERKDNRLLPKDWGKGIPNYSEDDLMVEEELLDFGMQIVSDYYIHKNGFTILETNQGVSGFPNFALEKNGTLYLLKVKCEVGNKPQCLEQDKQFYLSISKKFNAKCLYAPISIASSDNERASNKIALYGDGYYADFSGVVELN